MAELTFILNGRPARAAPGSVLDACASLGVEIPTLCHDPRLAPSSACRLCEVEVEGRERNPCACATPLEPGMVVRTHTPDLEAYRRGLLEMLARHYPPEAVEDLPREPFHRWLRHYGVAARGRRDPALADRTHPYIHVDLSQCIDCYCCVRICEELQGQFVWKVEARGARAHVVAEPGGALLKSPCVSCGACVDTCPTGALEDATWFERGPAEGWTRTTCAYCGTGCELEVGTREGRIVAARPVMDAPVNRGHLCVKGRYGTAFVEAEDRAVQPMVRVDGHWRGVSWDEALDAAADALLRIGNEHGSDALGFLGSSRATNEEAYLVQKLARLAAGTNNVDCCARVCHAPSAAGLGQVFGTGAATNSFDDIERASLLLVVGANATENHPIVGARLKQRAMAGVPLIVIDPRRIELAEHARIHLALRPGTNLPLLLAMARVILDERLEDRAFLESRTEGLEAFRAGLEMWTPARAAEICGVPAEAIAEAARLYAAAKPAMSLHGLGLTEQVQGTEGVMALAQLAMLTGNLGKPGAGVNPLRGQNNVQGAANMGCEPTRLTGYQPFGVARESHERAWGAPLPPAPGLSLMGMLDAALGGRLKGLVVFGYDLLLTNPAMDFTAKALSNLESLVVIDLFMTGTAKAHGTVFLPVASAFEKEGTFMNAERRIQRVRAAVPARGGAKTDLEVACLLGARLGYEKEFTFGGAEAVWNEVRELWPAVKGISYARLEAGGIQWPCPDEDHPGTPVLHASTFAAGPRAAFRPLNYRPSAEQADDAFPFILNTGRSLYHFNAATMTGRSRNRELEPDDWVEIHPEDAAELGLVNRDRVVVETRHGAFEGQARLSGGVRKGELFAVFHSPSACVNRATGLGRDSITGTPEYKVTAARLRHGG